MTLKLLRLLFLGVFLLALTACGGKEYAYVSANDDHTTPGLLSGEDGVFHLIEYKKKDETKVEGENVVEPKSEG